MKVPIVIYNKEGVRTQVGEAEVWADSWIDLPPELKMDLDTLVLTDKVEFIFALRKEVDPGELYVYNGRNVAKVGLYSQTDEWVQAAAERNPSYIYFYQEVSDAQTLSEPH